MDTFEALVVRCLTELINRTGDLLVALEEATDAETRAWFEGVLAQDDTGG